MNKETMEHISSLMDGELSRETGLFLARRLSADKELGGVWERFHLIRDCIRQPGGNVPLVDLSQRMKVALSEESEATVWKAPNRWLKPAAGMAIAASVALMAIVAVGPGQPLQGSGTDAEAPNRPFASPNVLPAAPRTDAASFSPGEQAREARLNSYLLRHNQASNAITAQGFLGFVPIVSSADTEEEKVNEQDAVADPQQVDPR